MKLAIDFGSAMIRLGVENALRMIKEAGFNSIDYHIKDYQLDDDYREQAREFKALLDKYGYSNAEMILNEWNYISNWTGEFVHSIEVIKSYKGAAYTAAVMSNFQDSPVHMMMYYDARPGTGFNGLFDLYTAKPRPAYYSLYSWTKLRRLGTQVKAEVGGLKDFYVTAAKDENGKLALLLTHYTDDRNVVAPIPVTISLKNFEVKEAISHVTDRFKMHTETPIEIVDSKATVVMEPNSYILIELR